MRILMFLFCGIPKSAETTKMNEELTRGKPGLDTFKLAMLNKNFQYVILNIVQPASFFDFRKNYETLKIIDIFINSPDFQ